ncbi:unnamed protein product [Withania somnifera]
MVDYRTKRVCFHFPNEAILEWEGNVGAPRGKFISYLKARKLMSKGYICHLVRVRDINVEPPTLQSVPVVNEFTDVFPEELPGFPPKREVEFGIDLIPDTQPSSIPPCIGDPSRITPIEDVQVIEKLSYEEVPIAILDQQVKKLRNKEVASVKVLWRNQQVEEVTWEAEEAMKFKYPHLFEFEEKVQQC